jgi:hypothetical protein
VEEIPRIPPFLIVLVRVIAVREDVEGPEKAKKRGLWEFFVWGSIFFVQRKCDFG